jgi:hypothetical protein
MRRVSFISAIVAFLTGCARGPREYSRSLQRHVGTTQGNMMQAGMMGGMMNVSQHDMNAYMQMFANHTALRRRVKKLANGVRTTTESDDLRLVALLQEHVARMYDRVDNEEEVRCMSDSLPTLFQNAKKYHRQLRLTPKGVVVTETSDDSAVLAAIRSHATEVTGFVEEGMPAMMRGMMGSQ